MENTNRLRQLLRSSELSFLMEAHNGLSARIAEEAGFQGLWASGLSIAAQLGVRDSNEASWTQVLEVVEFMCEAASIPVLVDGDTGHGNFNNMRRFVQKLEQRGVAGVCIEDKLFPKTNSFLADDRQQLADIEEFAGKIKAGVDARADSNFVIVARLEAFIAGWGVEEAMRRAQAYVAAGADAILVHSKKQTPADIEQFMQHWTGTVPVIVVPTKYFTTPSDYFRTLKVHAVIWANHSIRAAARAMQETTRHIFQHESVAEIENSILPLQELFRLQNAAELQAAEERYLPASRQKINAIILAASRGSEFGSLTEDIPKALLPVHGKPILSHIIECFHDSLIKDISVVRGYKKESIQQAGITCFDNDAFDSTREVASLFTARSALAQHTLISFGDIIFKQYFVSELLQSSAPITILAIPRTARAAGYRDYIRTAVPYSPVAFHESGQLEVLAPDLTDAELTGEFCGLWYVQGEGSAILTSVLEELEASSALASARMTDLFSLLLKRTDIAVRFLEGGWIDIDSVPELIQAGNFK